MNDPQNTPQNAVDRIIKFLEDWERLPLALVTMAGPWLTPLVPAYFVAVSIGKFLHAPWQVAVVAGIILEVVGIAGLGISTRSYIWNRSKRKSDPPAQLVLAITATSIYFITSLMLTVLLELRSELARIAPGMFVIMSVSSGLILVLSGLQNRREKAVRNEREEKREERRERRQSRRRESSGNDDGNFPAFETLTGNDTREKAKQILAQRPDITGADLGRALGRSESLGRKLRAELLPSLNGNQN